jgi:hypothetical protein
VKRPRFLAGAVLGALIVVLSLSGCRSETFTTVNVTGAGSASVEVGAELSGEAAQAIFDDPALAADLVTNVERLTGNTVDSLVVEPDLVRITTQGSFELLQRAGGITGVSEVSASSSADTTSISVSFGYASDLVQAVEDSARGRADEKAFTQTALANTFTHLSIIYPNEPTVLNSSGVEAIVTGNRVDVVRVVTDQGPGTLKVTGEHNRDGANGGLLILVSVVAIIALIFGGVLYFGKGKKTLERGQR